MDVPHGGLHIGGGIQTFLTDMRVPLQAFHSGYPDLVRKLCDVADQDPEPVLRNTIQRFSPYTYALRGEEFGSGLLIGRLTKFCPHCLLEDSASGDHPHRHRRERLAWLFRPVAACPIHGLQLMFAGPQPGIAPDLSCRVPLATSDLQHLATDATPMHPSPLQTYVLARLEGTTGPAWLDSQGLEQAVRATEMLGAVLVFGARVHINALTVEDWHEAACEGWEWTRRGEVGLREAFGLIQAEQPKTRMQLDRSPGQAFGTLYKRLANPYLQADCGPIKDVLRTHIIETEPVTTNRKILGELVHRNHIKRRIPEALHPV